MIEKPHMRSVARRVGRRDHECTEERWNELYHKQQGLCAICGVTMEPHGKGNLSACVDHCHASSEIRGLLCGRCNKGIGGLQDDPQIMQNAIHYVHAHRASSVWWKLFRKL